MKTFDSKMRELAKDFADMAKATRLTGWATSGDNDGTDIEPLVTRPEDIAGRQMNAETWTRGFLAAMSLSRTQPRLERPTVGAHPDGFITLTWIEGSARILDLQMRPEGYRWCQQDENGKRTVQSDSLEDVAEAMRAVFKTQRAA